jgi:hypothetical protein
MAALSPRIRGSTHKRRVQARKRGVQAEERRKKLTLSSSSYGLPFSGLQLFSVSPLNWSICPQPRVQVKKKAGDTARLPKID